MRFHENATDTDALQFTRAGGCWSNVGRVGGKQTVSIGYGCDAVSEGINFDVLKSSDFSWELSHMKPSTLLDFGTNNLVTIAMITLTSTSDLFFLELSRILLNETPKTVIIWDSDTIWDR